MDEAFKKYVERLRSGSKEAIQEECSPDFLAVAEEELAFNAPVTIGGEAYLAGDNLFVALEATTSATVPCTVCNEMNAVAITATCTIVEELSDIRSGVYVFADALREAILLETPVFTECCGGQCPQRKGITGYLNDEESEGNNNDEGQRPFANILN